MKTPQPKKQTTAVHLNLPTQLLAAVKAAAAKQYRTSVSLITQTLAEKFQKPSKS